MPEQSETAPRLVAGWSFTYENVSKRNRTETKEHFFSMISSLFLHHFFFVARRLHLAKGLKFFLISAVAQRADEELSVSFCLSKSCFNSKILILSFAVDSRAELRSEPGSLTWTGGACCGRHDRRVTAGVLADEDGALIVRWDLSLNTRTHP